MPTSRLELATIALQANALPIKLHRHKSKQNRTTITCVEDTGFTVKLYSYIPPPFGGVYLPSIYPPFGGAYEGYIYINKLYRNRTYVSDV